MKRVFLPLVFLALAACSRTPGTKASPSATTLSDAAPSASAHADAAPPSRIDAPLEWAFWAPGDVLVAASKASVWRVETSCAVSSPVPVAIDALYGHNGAGRFVVEHAGAFTVWDATTLRPLGGLEHPAPGRGGTLAPDGSLVALGGCKEVASDPKLATTCGEVHDTATGQRKGSFTTKHDIESLAFSDDGRYLVARGGTSGLTVVDPVSGKTLVTRPQWHALQEVHAWNRPDIAAVVNHDQLVVAHGDTVEHVDLTSGKTLGKLVTPGRTLAVYGARTQRVAVLQGEASRATIWDVATHKVARTFELRKHIGAGANCRHCALEIDEVDEDRVWLTSAYTDDRLELRIGSGDVKRVDAHVLRSDSVPSTSLRVEEEYDQGARQTVCSLDRRDRAAPSVALPTAYCNRTFGPSHRRENEWPYPGFSPGERHLAVISRAQLHVLDVQSERTECSVGETTAKDGPSLTDPRRAAPGGTSSARRPR